jgi:hypothetical protein
MVRNTIADRMLGTERTDWIKDFLLSREKAEKEHHNSKELSDTDQNRNANTYSNKLENFIGSYQNKGYGRFKILQEKDSLYAQFKLKKYYLKHNGNTSFTPFSLTDSGLQDSDLPPFNFQYGPEKKDEIIGVKIKLEAFLQKPIIFKRMQ